MNRREVLDRRALPKKSRFTRQRSKRSCWCSIHGTCRLVGSESGWLSGLWTEATTGDLGNLFPSALPGSVERPLS